MHARNAILLLLLSGPVFAAPDFERDVAPILVRHCTGCHNASESRGDLDLTRRERLLAGGASGPALVPGKDDSLLLKRIAAGEMPPKERRQSRQLPQVEQDVLRAWTRDGAAWPRDRVLNPYELTSANRAGLDWWSLRPLRRPLLPDARPPTPDARSPIDLFIAAKLQVAGLEPAPEADRRTLIRRVWFDLVGLPAPPHEIDAFVADDSPLAYERLVDRLLASPQHGERWARFWLDLVRYADTNGYERDAAKPNAWKYRDYVVRSLNSDKPYDRFLLEQLAGDELLDRSEETIIATGMLRVGTWDDEPNDKLEYKYDRLEDLVHVTTTAFLGVTVKCARCHDHKFDPIPQTDYYRFASAFWAGDLLGNPGGKVQGYEALAWTDSGPKPPPLHLLKKGDPRRPGKAIDPGFLTMLAALDRPFAPPAAESKSSQRRLQLARRIADPANPLTARVLVNRVWMQHFGAGLVRTPDNFGFKGDTPTHLELLDWLASDFIDKGWSLKRLHRLLLTSRTYRQASVHPRQEQYHQKDSANRLWWKMNRRRLEAEALRDSLLTASGLLNPRMGGPGFTPRISREAMEGLSRKGAAWQESPVEEQRRRGIYLFSRRSLIPPLMSTFDFCDTTRPIAQRDVTTVAPQALALMNNEFVHEQSTALAARVLSEAGEDRGRQVRLAWRFTLGREPRESEIRAALTHLEAQKKNLPGKPALALASLCHVLLNANEFMYVD